MRILGFDTSSRSACCALWEEGRLLGECFINNGLTHSQTILPMADSLLRSCETSLSEVDFLAVTVGPGSFTGLRIGMSLVQAMAFPDGKRVIPLSTLEALAYTLYPADALIVPVLDARRSQVYCALFESKNGGIKRLSPDAALSIDQLGELLKGYARPFYLIGDGAKLVFDRLGAREELSPVLPDEPHLYLHGGPLCLCAQKICDRGEAVSADRIAPVYLRLPQAERELLEKSGGK